MEKSVLNKLYEEYKSDIMNDEEYWKLNEATAIIIHNIATELPQNKQHLITHLNEAISKMTNYGDNANFNKAFCVASRFYSDINSTDI